jgi:hypothetical protein
VKAITKLMSQKSFIDLGVPAVIADVLASQGIDSPFPIQVDTLPDTLAGRDVLGRGKTGSGKTLAFSIPMVARLAGKRSNSERKPRGLVLAPTRERQYAQLQNQLFQTGRGGLSVGGTGLRPSGTQGLGASNPEMEAYYNAMAQQDAQLAAQAQAAGQQQTAFGAGLFGTGSQLLGQYQAGQVGALSPFQTSLGLGGTIEQMGQQGLQIGSELGGRTANAGANVGQALLTGGMGAARTAQAGNAFNPLANVLQGVGTNPYFAQTMQPYAQSQQAVNQYGAENVYGYRGQGQVPTSVNWDI